MNNWNDLLTYTVGVCLGTIIGAFLFCMLILYVGNKTIKDDIQTYGVYIDKEENIKCKLFKGKE